MPKTAAATRPVLDPGASPDVLGKITALISASDPERRWLNPKQAADFCDCHPKTLERKRYEGTGPVFFRMPGGRRVLYKLADLSAWLNANRHGSTSAETHKANEAA